MCYAFYYIVILLLLILLLLLLLILFPWQKPVCDTFSLLTLSFWWFCIKSPSMILILVLDHSTKRKTEFKSLQTNLKKSRLLRIILLSCFKTRINQHFPYEFGAHLSWNCIKLLNNNDKRKLITPTMV